MVYNFFLIKSKGINKTYKLVIRTFLKRVYSSFKDNIWGADLADM